MNQIILKKFNPTILEKKRKERTAPICIIIGRKSSGKSVLVQDLLYHLTDIPTVLCVSDPSYEFNECYSKYIPEEFKYSSYNSDTIKKIIKDNPETGIILDDFPCDKKTLSDITNDILNLKDHNTMLITFQYTMLLFPLFMMNIDYVFIFRCNIRNNIKRLYDYFFSCFDTFTFDNFKKVFDVCTKNYECLVIDNTIKSNKIEDRVFWYKAIPNIIDSGRLVN